MPQLDTSTWFITVLSSTLALFSMLQLKIYSQTFTLSPTAKTLFLVEPKISWEHSWTKIYLPLSLPLQ